MKSIFNWDQERYSGPANALRPYPPLPSQANPQSQRTARAVPQKAQGRWLATLTGDLGEVREAILATLSDLPAELAYLYHADDKIVIRAIQDDHQIRVEITPVEARSTRVVVACTLDGEVDRAMSTRIVQAIEDRLASEHA